MYGISENFRGWVYGISEDGCMGFLLGIWPLKSVNVGPFPY